MAVISRRSAVIGSLFSILFVVTLSFVLSDQDRTKKMKDVYIGEPIEAPFAVSELAPQEIPDGISCDVLLSATYAFYAYEKIDRALVNGDQPESISNFDCFLPLALSAETASDALIRFRSSAFVANVLVGYLEREFERNLKSMLVLGDAREGEIWVGSYAGQAALEAFKLKGDRRFLDLYVSYFDRLMELRDSQLGYYDDYHERIMPSWGATNLDKRPDGKPKWVAHITHFGVTMIPATGFAREIFENPALKNYRPWAEGVLDFFDTSYHEFDVDFRAVDGTDEKWYWRPLLNKFEATNHVHLLGQALLNAYSATKNPIYKERIESILRIFQEGATFHDDGTLSWKYSPYFQVDSASETLNDREYSEFTWKGSLTIPFLFQAESDGLLNNPELINALTKTIREYIVADGTYKINTHPNLSKGLTKRLKRKKPGAPSSIAGYLIAASVDPKIEKQIVEIVSSQPQNYPGGWLGTRNMAPAYGLLLNRNVGSSDSK